MHVMVLSTSPHKEQMQKKQDILIHDYNKTFYRFQVYIDTAPKLEHLDLQDAVAQEFGAVITKTAAITTQNRVRP